VKRYLPFGIIIAVFLVALGFGAGLYRVKQERISAPTTDAPAKGSAIQPGAEPPHSKGAADAPILLEEFGDFVCRPCGELFLILEEVEKDYRPRLRRIFRQFPIPLHKDALVAARASEAAGRQGRFWEMHDLLYRNQLTWIAGGDAGKVFEEYARTLGLDLELFKKDMAGEEVKVRVTADRQRAASLAVERMPAVFINGRHLPVTALTPSGLRKAIDAALNEAR
jgi:protein-disulfide isomerase